MHDVYAVVVARTGANAKTRLSRALGPEARIALAETMLDDVLRATGGADLGGTVAVVEPARDHGDGVIAVADPGTGHLGAIEAGIEAAVAAGARCVIVLPGDIPLLTSDDVRELAAAAASGPSVVVVPDRAGTGTNALVMRPPRAIAPAFGPGSLARHVEAARAAGVAASVHECERAALDIDTPDDLTELNATRGRHVRG